MKKILTAVSVVAMAALPGVVLAADLFTGTHHAYPLGGAAPAGSTSNSECALLAETVTLGVSANVVGGLACDEAANLVQVASCHSGGSRASGVACNSDADLNTPEIDLPPGCTDTTGNSDQPSFKAFTLSSAGGVMNEAPLAGRCTEGTLGGISWIN